MYLNQDEEEHCHSLHENFRKPLVTYPSSMPSDWTAAGNCIAQRHCVHGLLKRQSFELFIGFLVILNSITIGLAQSFRIEGRSTPILDMTEHIFLTIYVLEFSLRFFALGRSCLKDPWVQFDLFLIATGVVSLWILPPLMGGNHKELGVLQVFRTVRMLRLARAVRLLVRFRTLWMLLRGLLSSLGTMVYTLLILVIVMYVLSSIGLELIVYHPELSSPEPNEEFVHLVETHWSSLPAVMLTLLQFVCHESEIFRPLVELDVREGGCLLLIYFVGVVLILPIVLLNLVTAIIVNGAMEGAMADKEAQQLYDDRLKTKMVKQLKVMFSRIDQDGSGELSLEELMTVNEADLAVLCNLTSFTNVEDLFAAVDLDGSGRVTIDVFCDGIHQAAVSKVPIETQKMARQIDSMSREVKRRKAVEECTQDLLRQVQETLLEVRQAMRGNLVAAMLPAGIVAAPDGESHDVARSVRADAPLWATHILTDLDAMRWEIEGLAQKRPWADSVAGQAEAASAAHAASGEICRHLAAANKALLQLLGSHPQGAVRRCSVATPAPQTAAPSDVHSRGSSRGSGSSGRRTNFQQITEEAGHSSLMNLSPAGPPGSVRPMLKAQLYGPGPGGTVADAAASVHGAGGQWSPSPCRSLQDAL